MVSWELPSLHNVFVHAQSRSGHDDISVFLFNVACDPVI